LARTFAKARVERGLASVRKHMREEGENLKRILEAGYGPNKKSTAGTD
jgi:hypothetical protein